MPGLINLFSRAVLLLATIAGPLIVSADDREVLALARETMLAARYCALITLDERGQPRARTVDPFVPEEDFTIWMATRPITRKADQIAANRQVTLYYFDKETRSYVTLMGMAHLVDDVATKSAMRRPEDSERLYPEFPDDYLLIRFVPDYLEAIVPGYRGDPLSWKPVRVDPGNLEPVR